jgi:predicted metal-dependent peptidase
MSAQQDAAELRPSANPGLLRQGWFEAMLDETRFLQRYPYYAGVLARMIPVATNSVEVMAVCLRRWDDSGSTVQLMVNLDFFEKNPQYWAGVLLHEIQHVLLGHLTETKFHAVYDPIAMELAAEISANEYIAEPLPGAVILNVELFAKFGLAHGQSTMERYALLRQAFDKGGLQLSKVCGKKRASSGSSSSLDKYTFDTHRPCQGGAGGAGLGDLLDARTDGATEKNWRRNGGLARLGQRSSEIKLQKMKEMIAAHLQGERGGADDPFQDDRLRRGKEMSRTLVEAGPYGQLNWARILREAFPQRRLIQPNYLKPNRRFPARIGEIPGRQRRPPKPKFIVGIDTSGSMNGETLGRIAIEIRRQACLATLTLVECDAAIHRVYPMAGPLGPFIGGGDTNFVPVFDEARNARRFDGLVYFTDGKGNQPGTAPSVPTLWVLTNQDPFYPRWGKIVRLPE